MSKLLTSLQLQSYQEFGYVAPIRVMSAEQANSLRMNLEEFERSHGGPLKGAFRHKSHLLFSWLNDLVRLETIVDAVEDLYGQNLLCWTSNFFIKEAKDPAYVSWHQDSTYWGLSKPDVVTAGSRFRRATNPMGLWRSFPVRIRWIKSRTKIPSQRTTP